MIDTIVSLFSSIPTVITLIYSFLKNGLDFIIACLTTLPNFLINIFMDLPPIIYYGLTGLIGAIFLILLLKLVSLVH